jgi:hypothetical protein
MKLPTETRALFSFNGSVAFFRINSIRHASIFSEESVRSLMASRFSRFVSATMSPAILRNACA